MKFSEFYCWYASFFQYALFWPRPTETCHNVKSPDGKISITITAGASVNWSVKHEDTEMYPAFRNFNDAG